jgi:hypothetical protein
LARSTAAVLLVAAGLAGCGGGDDTAAPPPTTGARPAATGTVAAPIPGCDVVVVCVPQVAHETLARCPAGRLGHEGRHARKRLEKALAEIEGVDLHNKQADEASAAAVLALAQLERACA